jgi:hypothetical protein
MRVWPASCVRQSVEVGAVANIQGCGDLPNRAESGEQLGRSLIERAESG